MHVISIRKEQIENTVVCGGLYELICFSVHVKCEVVIALLCNCTVCLIFMAQMWYYTRF
jgi:hypothetical protein